MPQVIQDLRLQIDKIDDEILKLLIKRMQIAQEIGKVKNKHQKEILDLQREEEILKRLSQKGFLNYDKIQSIYQPIFNLTKQLQEE